MAKDPINKMVDNLLKEANELLNSNSISAKKLVEAALTLDNTNNEAERLIDLIKKKSLTSPSNSTSEQKGSISLSNPTIIDQEISNNSSQIKSSKIEESVNRYEGLLKQYFGFKGLRDSQKDVLVKLQSGNVLAVLPTGSGKSMCFILPAIERGKTVVVSPLISLMQDQSNKLAQHGIHVGFINSSLSYEERNQNLESFTKGEINIIYVAPERFTVPGFLDNLARTGIELMAIDEAHCISEWGHNFRPDYLNLSEVRKVLKPVRTIAMTATADEMVRKDIIKRLNMDCSISLGGFNRPNLFF